MRPPNVDLTKIRIRVSERVDEEGNKIQSLIVEIRQHIRVVKLHLTELEGNPESSNLITYSILAAILLFFIGVVYPLSFLPVSANGTLSLSIGAFFTILFSLKGVILSSVSLIFLLIMAIFFYVNWSLKHNATDLERLRSATQIKNYSKYLEIMEENEHSSFQRSAENPFE
jgi:uncharacterized membrane protein